MKYNDFTNQKLHLRFLSDLPKKRNQKTKKYSFSKSLNLVYSDLKIFNPLNNNISLNSSEEKEFEYFKRIFNKLKILNLSIEKIEIVKKFLESIKDNISKLEFIKIDKKSLIILDDTFILELLKKKEVHTNFILTKNIISLLKVYKIISEYSQEIKITKRKNNNGNHLHYLKSDLYYYDQVKKVSDDLINDIYSEANTKKREKLFFIYLKLYTIKKYSKDLLKYINIQNLKHINENLVVLIYVEDSKIKVEFFEELLNNLLLKVFFSKSTNILDYYQYIEFSELTIEEHISINYKNIINKFISIDIKNKKQQTNMIKNIIRNNMAMNLQFKSSSFNVTTQLQTIYPIISYSELLTIYPKIYDKELVNLENINISIQKEQYSIPNLSDLDIENYIKGRLLIGDEEEVNMQLYLDQDLSDYYKLRSFKSFIQYSTQYKIKNDKKYKSYLADFLKFLYGTTLGELIFKIETQVEIKNHFETRELLLESIIKSLKVATSSLVFSESYNNKVEQFYELFLIVIENKDNDNIKTYLESSDPLDYIESILKTVCNKFNPKSNNIFAPRLNNLVLEMAYHVESIINKSKYSIYSKEFLATSTIYNRLNILFKHCFSYIIKNANLSKTTIIEIEQGIEYISKNNSETGIKYKGLINSFLSKFELAIDVEIEKIKYANKSFVFKSELERLIDSLYTKSPNSYNKSYLTHDKLKMGVYYILAFYSGLREIELLTRLRKDIFISENIVFIDVNTKGLKITNTNDGKFKSSAGKRRVKFIIDNEKYLEILNLYFKNLIEDNIRFIFPLLNENTKLFYKSKMEKASFLNKLNLYLQKILNDNQFGITRYVTLHSFRHSYATYSLKEILHKNREEQSKSDFMDFLVKIGHSEPNITFKFYIHLDFILYKLNL